MTLETDRDEFLTAVAEDAGARAAYLEEILDVEADGFITPDRYLDYPINTNECAD